MIIQVGLEDMEAIHQASSHTENINVMYNHSYHNTIT